MTPTNRRLRLVLQPLAVLALAVACAVVIGWLAVMGLSAGADPSNGWGDLAAAVTGMLVGAAAGLVAWVVGLVWLSRRLFPRGGRAGAVVLAVLAVVVLGVVLAWVGLNLRELGGLLLGAVVLAAPSVVFVLWDRRSADPRAAEVAVTSRP